MIYRVKQSLEPAAMFVCRADTQQRRGYWDRGAGAGETSQDLKQKNNLWLENRDAVQRISGFMLCYSSKTKRTPRLS